jgi:AcrR family transcriptional regulator
VGAPLTETLRTPSLRTKERAPAQPRQVRSIEKRRKLLEAGRRLFAAKGYAEVSVAQIAAQAGVAAGGFYLHFASKKQFLVVLMQEFLGRLAGLDLRAAGGGGDPETALTGFLTRAFRADADAYGVVRAWREAAFADAELGRMESEIQEWTDARVLAVFRQLSRLPGARRDRDLPAFARMINRHFWSLLARGAVVSRRDLEREIRVAADAIRHYLFRDV